MKKIIDFQNIPLLIISLFPILFITGPLVAWRGFFEFVDGRAGDAAWTWRRGSAGSVVLVTGARIGQREIDAREEVRRDEVVALEAAVEARLEVGRRVRVEPHDLADGDDLLHEAAALGAVDEEEVAVPRRLGRERPRSLRLHPRHMKQK